MRVPEVEEETKGEPRELVVRNARRKAEAVAPQAGDALVIAGDTEVVIDGEVLWNGEDLLAMALAGELLGMVTTDISARPSTGMSVVKTR